ncbi:unnamed protein product [Symbiodinium sp. CCMP2456]|nr:unnamed protein product [Symbiodinium sp. CCMP2456]
MRACTGHAPKLTEENRVVQARPYSRSADCSSVHFAKALTRKNIGNLVRAVGLNPSKSDLHAIIKQADSDGSGDLDFEEFMIIVAQVIAMTPTPSPEEYERDMRELFEAIDLDGSGFISSRELIVALSTKGPEPMEPDEVKKVLGRIDKDGDGKMNFREFCKIMDG